MRTPDDLIHTAVRTAHAAGREQALVTICASLGRELASRLLPSFTKAVDTAPVIHDPDLAADPHEALLLAQLDHLIHCLESHTNPDHGWRALHALWYEPDALASVLAPHFHNDTHAQKAVAYALFLKAAERSPKGGISLKGTFYPGGQWIPSSVIATASPEEKTELSERSSGARPNPLNARERVSQAARNRRGTRDEVRKRIADIGWDILRKPNDRTPDKYRDLAEAIRQGVKDGHVSLRELRETRLKLGASFAGARRKDLMVAALLHYAEQAGRELSSPNAPAETHEQTRDEFRQHFAGFVPDAHKGDEKLAAVVGAQADRIHKQHVERALKEGRDVSWRVLDAYPDLKAKYKTGEEESAQTLSEQQSSESPSEQPSVADITANPGAALGKETPATAAPATFSPNVSASPLHVLAQHAHDPAKLQAEAKKLEELANRTSAQGGSLAFHDAMTAALRGEHGPEVRDAVSRALDDWHSHGGSTAKRYARVAEEMAKLSKAIQPQAESLGEESSSPAQPARFTGNVTVSKFDPGATERLPGVLSRVFGTGATPAHVADALGAEDGAQVRIGQARTLEDGNDYIGATIKTPEGISASRSLNYDPKTGRKWIVNDTIHADSPGQGYGTALFARQAQQAAALGINSIEAGADRGAKNGYYTLPRWGFDGSIPAVQRAKLPPELAHAKTLLDLMETPAGRAWWKQHGVPVDTQFDLTPGSRSQQALAKYLAEKSASRSTEITPQEPLPSHEELTRRISERRKQRDAAGRVSEHAPPSEEEFAAASKPAQATPPVDLQATPEVAKLPSVADVVAAPGEHTATPTGQKFSSPNEPPAPAHKEPSQSDEQHDYATQSARSIVTTPDESERDKQRATRAALPEVPHADVIHSHAESVEREARKSSVPWDVSGADRISLLNDIARSGNFSNAGNIAEAIRNYANRPGHLERKVGQTVESLAKHIISRMTPAQKANLANEYRVQNKHNPDTAPVMRELLAQHEPAEHARAREEAVRRLANMNLTDEQRKQFAERIRGVKGDNEEAVVDATYGVLGEAQKSARA